MNKEKENKYLILRFTCNSGILTIENTKENKQKILGIYKKLLTGA